jgi:hypothetical protein
MAAVKKAFDQGRPWGIGVVWKWETPITDGLAGSRQGGTAL